MFPSHADMSPRASVRPAKPLELAAALLLAVFLTILVDSFTGVMPPRWDPEAYTDMAVNGVIGNDHLVAPFAYRPAVPLMAGALSRSLGIPVDAAFLWIARVAITSLFFLAFLLSRRFAGGSGPNPWRALIPVFFTAAAVMPVKFALFVPASVDAAAYPVMVLAVWAFFSGRTGLSLCVAAAGLFFKEFLAIPLFLAVATYAQAWRRARTARALWTVVGAVVLAMAVILIPRLALDVVATYQEIDPQNNLRSLGRLVLNPLNLARDVNIVFCLLSFWFPVLLLLTRARAQSLLRAARPWRAYLAGFLALNLILVMYGGTNIFTFVSYAIPIQIIALAVLASRQEGNPRRGEWVLALVFTVVYNRVFGAIPFPDDGFDAYIDHYAGWGSRVNLATLFRFLEMTLYLGIMIAARRFVFLRLYRHGHRAA